MHLVQTYSNVTIDVKLDIRYNLYHFERSMIVYTFVGCDVQTVT